MATLAREVERPLDSQLLQPCRTTHGRRWGPDLPDSGDVDRRRVRTRSVADMAATLPCAEMAELPAVLDLWAAGDPEPTQTDDTESLTWLVNADPEALVVAVENGVIVGSVIAGWDDPRIKAAVLLAGAEQPFLVVHGAADPSVPYAARRKVFSDVSSPKRRLTVPPSEVPGTDHNQPYVGTEGRILPATRIVITTTVGFLDRYPSKRLDALDPLRKSVNGDVGFDLRVVER